MSTQAADTIVRHSIVVEAPIERAFKVFTEDFGKFKPKEHNLLRVPIVETVFEPRVGGNIYDRSADGSECRWANV
ncbi:MAG: ATPase, partial [Mesorhizobium sp.]